MKIRQISIFGGGKARLVLVALPALIACGAIGFAITRGQTKTEYQEIVLPGDGIARQIEGALRGTSGLFNCDLVDSLGKRYPGCFVQFGSGLGDRRFEFSLPDRVIDLGYGGQITYKINNVRLSDIHFSNKGGEFVLRAGFTSKGAALKGEHSFLGDAVVPDIELKDMVLAVHLKPAIGKDGGITYDRPRVEFTAKVDNTFMPRFTILGETVDVVDALTNYRTELCRSIQGKIQDALEQPERKEALARKIQDGISGQIGGPTSAVVALWFRGTDLVVRLRR